MSCYSCGGNPNTFCGECNYPKDTWIAPVDKLPDPFMGDFDHLFRTPDGNMYALAPERDRWIRVNGEAGNSVSYNDTELKKRITALEGRTDNFVSGIGVSREGDKVKLKYTFIDGTSKEVEFEDKDTKSIAYDDSALKARVSALETKTDNDTVYDDSTLKARVKALEDKPAPTIPKEPVHRFYNGDIPGAGNPADIKTVSKNNFRNPDGIKAGDTLEDFATDSNSVSRGIWKVLEVDGANVKVQGIGNYFTNLRKNLNYNPDTKQLSIDGGNTITLPSEKQTISKQGNKLILSNGGGEVELPQPNNTRPYDDSPLVNRVKALEAKEDKDTKYSATGRGLILNDKNQFSLDIKRTLITDSPYDVNETLGVPLTPKNRFDLVDLPNYIAYATDYNGAIQNNAILQTLFLFSFFGNTHTYGNGTIESETFQEFNVAVTTLDLKAVRNYGGFSLILHKGVKIEGNIYSRWVDLDSNKSYFAILAKIVWDVNLGSHVEQYEHYITKEELDSGEPIQIEIIEDGTLKRDLNIYLENTRFEIRSSQGTIALKDPSDSNYYYPENIRTGVKRG